MTLKKKHLGLDGGRPNLCNIRVTAKKSLRATLGGVHIPDWVTTPLAAAITPQEGNLTTHTTSRRAAAIAFAGAGAIALATMAPAAEFPGIAPGTALSVSLAAATDSIQAFIDDVRNRRQERGQLNPDWPLAPSLPRGPVAFRCRG